MDTRSPLDGRALGLMVFICFLFSTQQVVLKGTADDIAPIMQIGFRSALAALLIGALMVKEGAALGPVLRVWRGGLVAGLLFALEFILLGEGLRHTSAAHAVIFLYSAPIFAALGLHWKLPSERLALLQWGGILLAFGGIAVAFLVPTAGVETTASLYGDALCLLAGLFWGTTTVVIRTTGLSNLPAKPTLLYQLLTAAVLLPLAGWVMGDAALAWTPQVMAGLAYQAVMVSFSAMLLWFWLLRHYLASRIGVLSFLTPMFGVLLGAVLLNETLELPFIIGAVMVTGGIVLVSGESLLRARRSPAAAVQPCPPKAS